MSTSLLFIKSYTIFSPETVIYFLPVAADCAIQSNSHPVAKY